MLFKEIIGLNEVKQNLTEMVKNNRLSHALLFLGKEGCGTLPLAISFAQYVVCLPKPTSNEADMFGNISADNDAQNIIEPNEIYHQPSYQKANQLIHPDLHFSFPVITKKVGEKPTSKDFIADFRDFVNTYSYGNVYDWLQAIGAENKQGNITAEECNDIIRKLSFKSFESNYKVLVMWMPEYLGKEGNKLLKLIEEPPPNTLFILAAENEEQILPTILSRCQLVRIPKLSNAEIAEALINRCNASQETAHQIAAISNNNYREALQLLQHAEADWLSVLKDFLNAAIRTNTAHKIKIAEVLNELGREKQKQFIQYFLHIIEQSLRINILGNEAVIGLENEKEISLKLSTIATSTQLEAMMKELNNAVYFIERNANGKMLFSALAIKLHYILKHNSVVELA